MRSSIVTRSVVGIAAILALSLAGCGSSGGGTSADSTQANPRIINGTAVDPLASPQIVRISIIRLDGQSALCSGTVLDDNHVLTAGHCFARGALSATVDSVGGSVGASRVVIHPGYAESAELQAIFNDVAVLETSGSIGAPALGLLASRAVTVDESIGIWGYGLDEDELFGSLKTGTMAITSVTPNHIGAIFDDQSNTCNGDSGGPATAGLFDEAGNVVAVGVVGVTSTGSNGDCSEGDNSLFTNIQTPEIIGFITSVAPGAAVF